MIQSNWIRDVANHLSDSHPVTKDEIVEIIAEHCPFKPGTAYMPVIQVRADFIDWARHAAEYIYSQELLIPMSITNIAAVIATFARPLVMMVHEAKREHSRGYNDESCDYPPCPLSYEDGTGECNCGADIWNARIDKALAGE